jgi:hypothetical protein
MIYPELLNVVYNTVKSREQHYKVHKFGHKGPNTNMAKTISRIQMAGNEKVCN